MLLFSPQEMSHIIDDYMYTRITNYVGFVSFTMLVWDHLITLGDEVEFIWKGKKGFPIWLFLINRYLAPFGFILNILAYLAPPVWTSSLCNHFVKYEGAMGAIGINIVALMMLVRIYALYLRSMGVVGLVAVLFLIEFSVQIWLVTTGGPVLHYLNNDGIRACSMIFNAPPIWKSASAWLPLLYDTLVISLTLYRGARDYQCYNAGLLMRVLLCDGLMYYCVIFSVNLILTIMLVAAPFGIQNVAAQLEYLLTVAMMSRLTINLRKQAALGSYDSQSIELVETRTFLPTFVKRSQQTHVLHIEDVAGHNVSDEEFNRTEQLQSEV